jgi:hypothetical protein
VLPGFPVLWEWASNDKGYRPERVMACGGDAPARRDIGAGRAHPSLGGIHFRPSVPARCECRSNYLGNTIVAIPDFQSVMLPFLEGR